MSFLGTLTKIQTQVGKDIGSLKPCERTKPEIQALETVNIEPEKFDAMCGKHVQRYSTCDDCYDKLIYGFTNRKRSQNLLKKLRSEVEATDKLKGEIEFLKHELNDLCVVNKVPPTFRLGDLYKELSTKPLPKSFFTICESAESALSYFLKLGILPSTPTCKKCGDNMKLQGRAGLGFIYKCLGCRARQDIKTGTFWEKVPMQVNQILWYMILWAVKARDIEIANLMELSHAFISGLTAKIRKILSKDYIDKLPKFTGVVEIDIKNFIKRKIEIGKSKAKERWVLIMVERERKITHMQALCDKSFEVILKIVQERCEIGTVIVTENWGVYGRLEDYGFPHYKLDVAKGFAHLTNPKINISNAYGQWAWVKHAIKRYNRISANLTEHLNEYQWRRNIKLTYKAQKFLEGMLSNSMTVISKAKYEESPNEIEIEDISDDD